MNKKSRNDVKTGSLHIIKFLMDEQTETADLLRKHGGKMGEELKAEGK